MVDFVDWPRAVSIRGVKVRALSSRIEGALTLDGVAYGSPEPGGRWAVDLGFATLKDEEASRLYGWLLDELDAGTVVRLPVPPHVETVSAAALGVAPPGTSLPYVSNGVESYHSDGSGIALVPTARVIGAVLAGVATVAIDMGGYGQALKPGHLIGFGDCINRVRSISWAGSVATVGLRMPLQQAVADEQVARLWWQRMLVQADRQALRAFRALHDYGFLTSPGTLTLMEYKA